MTDDSRQTPSPSGVQADLDAAAGPDAAADPDGRDRLQLSEAHDVVDLIEEGRRLLDKARASGTGRAVRAVVRQPGQSLILLALPAGGGLPDHDAPGPASLQCLTGEVVLAAGGREWPLPAGRAVFIPQERHEVRALADSLCLLAVSLPVR